ncbi:hypothetical protein Tco_1153266 [Tanacetum coccineum]
MESSSLNSNLRELQQIQLEKLQLHSNCMAWFKELKIHLGNLHKFSKVKNTRPFEIAFRIFFHEEHQTFREKITPFKEIFDSKEVNASDFHNKCWQKDFKYYTRCEPETYRRNLLWYLEELYKLIDERVLKYGELQMKEREANLSTDGTTLDASLVTEGATLEYSLVTEGISLDASLVAKKNTVDSSTSLEHQNKCNSSRNECSRLGNENRSSDNESSSSGNDADDDIGPSYDSDTVTEVHHSNNDTFENVFARGIQNHEQPKSIPDTYVVNENNSDIISDIPNMDQVRDKEEHDDVDDEQQRAFFASLINNLKCAVEKCMKVNHEAQQANALLTKSLRDIRKKKNILQRIRQLNLNTAKRLSF